MSYYSRRAGYRRSWYQKRVLTSTRPIGPRKAFDVTSYLKNEFFNADDKTFARIAHLYKQLYGYGPYKYLLETFYSWKSGHVRVSGQTTTRILECVPKFLTDDKRFYILKCEIVHFVETLHFKQQNKAASLAQLNSLFEDYAKEIESFNQVNLTWFVSKGIFTEAEIQQFLSVCKYALREKLDLSYRQVQNDLTLIKSKFSGLKTGTFTATYRIDFLSSTVNLAQINEIPSDRARLPMAGVQVDGKFKRFTEEYILEELMKMSFAEKEGEVNRFIKAKDIDFFISQHNAIVDKGGEASLKSSFKGEGGQLSLSMEVKSLPRIHAAIFMSLAKLGLYAALLLVAAALVIIFHLYRVIVLLIIGGWIVAAALLGAINTEVQTLRSLKEDLKRYGT